MIGHTITVSIQDDELRASMLSYAKELVVTAYRAEIQSQIDKAITDLPDKALAKFESSWAGNQQAKRYHAVIHEAMLLRLSTEPEWRNDLNQVMNTIVQEWFNSVNTHALVHKTITNAMDNKYKHLLSGLTGLLELIETRKSELQDMLNEIKTLKSGMA